MYNVQCTMCNVGTATIRPSRLWEYSMLCNCFTTCLLPWKGVLWREKLPTLEHLAFKTRFKIYKLTLLINQDIIIIATENFKDSFKFSRQSLQVNNDESVLMKSKELVNSTTKCSSPFLHYHPLHALPSILSYYL